MLEKPTSRFLLHARYIAIEILSEDDRMSQVLEKLAEYESAGTAHIWLIDPRLETLAIHRAGTLRAVDTLATPATSEQIELTREDVFTGK